jgi:hypothetical protein
MTVGDLLGASRLGDLDFQRLVNAFVDEFRRADRSQRHAMVADGPRHPGKRAGLIAAIVSALCREGELPPPGWVREIYSPEPFFAFPAHGFALRLRLMLESPRELPGPRVAARASRHSPSKAASTVSCGT